MLRSHKGQVDKAGRPYWKHPLRVALTCDSYNARVVALLHDVIEDTNATLSDLHGFQPEILQAVEILTRRPEETYTSYICRVSTNPLATAVKIQDLKHNLDLSRLNTITDKDRLRAERYKNALHTLARI